MPLWYRHCLFFVYFSVSYVLLLCGGHRMSLSGAGVLCSIYDKEENDKLSDKF